MLTGPSGLSVGTGAGCLCQSQVSEFRDLGRGGETATAPAPPHSRETRQPHLAFEGLGVRGTSLRDGRSLHGVCVTWRGWTAGCSAGHPLWTPPSGTWVLRSGFCQKPGSGVFCSVVQGLCGLPEFTLWVVSDLLTPKAGCLAFTRVAGAAPSLMGPWEVGALLRASLSLSRTGPPPCPAVPKGALACAQNRSPRRPCWHWAGPEGAPPPHGGLGRSTSESGQHNRTGSVVCE